MSPNAMAARAFLEGDMTMNNMIAIYRKWANIRGIRAELNAMNDFMLEDIGLCRADIPR